MANPNIKDHAHKGGRPKGKPNQLTADVKQMILNALTQAGGEKYLVQQAQDNPTAFMTLLGKVIPKDMNIGGQDGNPIKTRMEIVIVEPDGNRRSL